MTNEEIATILIGGAAKKSPFQEGCEARRNGQSWISCPYSGCRHSYEQTEWLRGYSAQEQYP